MANDKTYYIKLTANAGGRLMTVTGVETYTRGAETVHGDNYRDIFRDAGGTGYMATPDAGSAAGSAQKNRVSDDIMQTAGDKQFTRSRDYHLFSNSTGGVLGFFWDDFVVAVSNSNTLT